MKNMYIMISILIFISISCSNKEKYSNNNIRNNNQDSTENLASTTPLKNTYNCNMSFDDFFDLFSKDSLFQKNSIFFPLNFLYIEDLETDKIVTEKIDGKNDFKYINFTEDKNAMSKEFDKYTIDIESYKDSAIYYQNGYDNGIKVQFHFKKIDSCWFMTSIHDWST